jgi:hypothetical protein
LNFHITQYLTIAVIDLVIKKIFYDH